MAPALVTYDHSLFEDAPSSFTSRSVCMGIYGPTDSGRTTLAFTAPGPIAYCHTLEKKDGLVERVKRGGKDVKLCAIDGNFAGNRDQVQLAANAAFTRLEKAVLDALKWARTIIFDTDKELWTICQLARLGTMTRESKSEDDKRKGQLIYQEINARWMTLLKQYRRNAESPRNGVGTNLILISPETSEYKVRPGDKAASDTGKKVRDTQKQVPAFCDVTIRTSKVKMLETTFKGVIEKPWFNNEVRDLELEGELLSFPAIMELITEVDAGEWS